MAGLWLRRPLLVLGEITTCAVSGSAWPRGGMPDAYRQTRPTVWRMLRDSDGWGGAPVVRRPPVDPPASHTR